MHDDPEAVERRIAELQEVQKVNPTDSAEWKAASAELQPLFAEMVRRQKEGQS